MRWPAPDLPASWPPGFPTHRPVRADDARRLDRDGEAAGVPSFVLMEHASLGVAAVAGLLVPPQAPILVLAGPGNNGGDGYGAARFLASWGRPVRVLRAARSEPSGDGDAAREFALLSRDLVVADLWVDPDLLPRALAKSDLVVDALFGVGLTRDLDAPYPDWIRAVNDADALRLAVDVPSGLDADEGTPRPVAIRADVTATMAVPKRGLLTPGPGREHAGHVIEIDIGLPKGVHEPFLDPPVPGT